MLVGVIGVVEGADFCLALNDSHISAAESSELDLWGIRLDALTAESVAEAKERGAAFVSFLVADAQAAALLDDEMDYVIRLDNLRIEEADARTLGSLRPAELAVAVDFPVSLSAALALRRLALLAATPLGVKCAADIDSGDIEVLRDAGVGALVLDEGSSSDDVAEVRQRIADLPERKPKRGEDAQPLIPTMRDASSDGLEGE